MRSSKSSVILLRRLCSSSSALRKTPLHALHVERGAQLTPFGGWDMPLMYDDFGILKEHQHCRSAAGLFDVSHMLGVRISGNDRVRFAERVTPADIESLPIDTGCLTSLPNERGGLIDDCIVTKTEDFLYLVINAGHEEKDLPHLEKESRGFDDVTITPMYGQGMLALQGPDAASVLDRIADSDGTPPPSDMSFMQARTLKVGGVSCFVTRSGYTGEDGFELSIPGDAVDGIARSMLNEPEVEMIGLGARDSLRLEAGMCLYGNDIDDDTTPIEAGLLWTIGKRRRKEGGFVGADVVLGQIQDKSKVTRKRVGIALTKKGPPPRTHDKIYDAEGKDVVGEITSGVFGPTAKKPVAMGYVAKEHAKRGTSLKVEIRGKLRDIEVAKMPFVSPKYKK